MSVVAADLKQPKGHLERALFPSDADDTAFDLRLTGYIADGVARVAEFSIVENVDAATTAWAYYRAYYTIGQRLLAQERSATIEGQGSNRFEQKQADGFFALAAQWKATFEGLIPDATAPVPAAVPSASLTNEYRW